MKPKTSAACGSRSIAFFCLALFASRSPHAEPLSTLPPKVPIKITVKPAKEKFKAGEPIKIAVEILNTSRESLFVVENLKVFHANSKRKRVPRRTTYYGYFHIVHESHISVPDTRAPSGTKLFKGKMRLYPGDSCAGEYIPSILYDMTAPGKYEIIIELTLYAGDEEEFGVRQSGSFPLPTHRRGTTESKPVIVEVETEPFGDAPRTVIRRAKKPGEAE